MAAIALVTATSIKAQPTPQIPPLPIDSAVITGTLPNGLTYVVRHNEYPKGQADFFIAQKVGSVLEEDNQRGLAHFLEHMAFNGSEHYPDTKLRDWLATKGVKFGRDLNAYTSFDKTVYNISSVPVNGNVNVVDSCLLILKDWSNGLTLADKAIDEERGVIEQEWRRRNVGQQRILEKTLPGFFPDSARYGNRLPIGTMDVVLNFKPDDLRKYYHRWYRPDQQAIIVVGDINADQVVEQIKKMFSGIPLPADAPERKYFSWGNTPGTKVAIGSDPEQQVNMGIMLFAEDPMPRDLKLSMMGAAQEYVYHMITYMFNQRAADIASKSDAPFMQAQLDYGDFFGFVRTKDALELSVVAKDGNITPAMEAAYRELRRIVTGGFTESEFTRAKAEYISALEKVYNNRATYSNTNYATKYVDWFTEDEPIPGLKAQLDLARQFGSLITLAQINEVAKELLKPDNRFVWIALSEKENVKRPSETDILSMISKVDGEEIAAFKEELRTDPLIANEPVAGKIVSIKQMKDNIQEWKLSNGARVIVMPTKYKEDEILFKSRAKGGLSGYSELSDNDAIALPFLKATFSGGSYSTPDLEKYLAGKSISIDPYFDDFFRGFTGTSTVKDLPSLLETFYACYTTPNLDAEEFKATIEQYAGLFDNMAKNPQMEFNRDILKSLYRSGRKQMVSSEIIRKANREEILKMATSFNRNAADYTYYFVGNVNVDSLKPLVEKYIASLPSESLKATGSIVYDPALGITPGTVRDDYTMKMETPQMYTLKVLSGNIPYSLKSSVISNLVSTILTDRLVKKVREEMGAVYSIGASVRLDRVGRPNATLMIQTPMKPEMTEQAIVAIDSIINETSLSVNAEELQKAKEILIKDIKEDMETNRAWLSNLEGIDINGVDRLNGAVKAVESVNEKDVQSFLRKLINQGNNRTVVLAPKN